MGTWPGNMTKSVRRISGEMMVQMVQKLTMFIQFSKSGLTSVQVFPGYCLSVPEKWISLQDKKCPRYWEHFWGLHAFSRPLQVCSLVFSQMECNPIKYIPVRGWFPLVSSVSERHALTHFRYLHVAKRWDEMMRWWEVITEKTIFVTLCTTDSIKRGIRLFTCKLLIQINKMIE